MSARAWTREKLDRVHPLPPSWRWSWDTWSWVAEHVADEIVVAHVGVVDGELDCDGGPPPADVVLAVILAAKGLDSYETMAAEMERRAADAQARASVGGGFSDCIHAARADGQQREAVHAAAMLRRGTVRP